MQEHAKREGPKVKAGNTGVNRTQSDGKKHTGDQYWRNPEANIDRW